MQLKYISNAQRQQNIELFMIRMLGVRRTPNVLANNCL